MTHIPVQVAELVGLDYLNEVARAHYRKTTSKTVVNTVSVTDLLNGEITIDAGAMGSTRALRISAWGDYKQNSGATQAYYRFALLFGGTTIFDTGAPAGALVNSTTRVPWRLDALLLNTATNIQTCDFGLRLTGTTAFSGSGTFATGEGNYGPTVANGVFTVGWAYNTAAVDTTVNRALVLNVTLPVASANTDIVLAGALIEVV